MSGRGTKGRKRRTPRLCSVGLIGLYGFVWAFNHVPSVVVGTPTSYTADAQAVTPLRVDVAKSGEVFPRRNVWELISSSSDVIPLRSRLNNGSTQWGTVAASHNPQQSVETRLQKLDHHFNSLKVFDDDCRQRLLCEIAESPAKFAPLTSAFLDETSFNGDDKSLASKLLETNDGTRLLTYIEAAQRGASRQGCEIWTYRCHLAASSMIDFKALLVWREISKWLTVKFVAKKHHQK